MRAETDVVSAAGVTAAKDYRPDIDGLRALAVTTVLLYHANLALPGGYVGVDIFFVISGYLITSILKRDISAGTFSFPNFWERRVRRLVPALFVMALCTSVVAYWLLLPGDLADLGGALVSLPLLMVNIYLASVVKEGYFGDPPETRPLLHTWSLGVEEQFYLLFPALLAVIYTRPALKASARQVLLCLTLVSLSLSIVFTPFKTAFSFFCLPTRSWEFLVGSLAAVLPQTPRIGRVWGEVLAWTGLVLVLVSVQVYGDETPFPGYAALAPCLGAALMLWANQSRKTAVGRGLSVPALTFIGTISYSVYLWHWPLIAFTTYIGRGGGAGAKVSLLLTSYLFGYLSWRLIERPFRERRLLATRSSVLWAFVLQGGILALVGGVFWANDGFAAGLSERARRLATNQEDATYIYDVRLKIMAGETGRAIEIGDVSQAEPAFLLWGDSHAMSAAHLLSELGREYHLKGLQLTATASAPLSDWNHLEQTRDWATRDYKTRWFKDALDLVEQKHIKKVFLIGYWSIYEQQALPEQVQETAMAFRKLGAEVVLVGDAPTQAYNVPRAQALTEHRSLPAPSNTTPGEHRAKNHGVYQAATRVANWPGVRFIDLAGPVLEWETLSDDGHAFYSDDNHLSRRGVLQLRSLFTPEFHSTGPANR